MPGILYCERLAAVTGESGLITLGLLPHSPVMQSCTFARMLFPKNLGGPGGYQSNLPDVPEIFVH